MQSGIHEIAVQLNTVDFSTVECSQVHEIAVQLNTVDFSTVQYSRVQSGT